MRGIVQALVVSAVVWGGASAAVAQTSLGEFGGYPTGSGRITSGQPYVYYGANNFVPRTGPYSVKPSYSYRPGVSNYPSYRGPGTYVPRVRLSPGRYTDPDAVTYGTVRTPNTAVYGPLTPGGYATFIEPSYRGYVMPQGNFVRQYVR
jgi:hypothetical protein